MQAIEDRLLSKIREEEDCWIWTGTKDNDGYGRFSIEANRYRRAHRVIWELYNGPIPEGHVIRHRCPSFRRDCVNPDHLLTGTVAENSADRITDGTSCKGERNGSHILTQLQVNRIRAELPTNDKIKYCEKMSQEFQVSLSAIKRIVYNRSWKK